MHRIASRLIHGLVLIMLAGCAQTRSVPERATPPENINDRFLDPDMDPQQWVERFEGESREIFSERDAIVTAVNLAPGESIADIGAGTGLFLAPFSNAVGVDGTVWAVDISPGLVDYMNERVQREGLDNVNVVLSTETSTKLPPDSVDVVFVCDTYHHFSQVEPMLTSIRQALRPGGRLVIIDFIRIPGQSREWVLDHVRAGQATFSAEIQAAGFEPHAEVHVDGFSDNYFLIFKRT